MKTKILILSLLLAVACACKQSVKTGGECPFAGYYHGLTDNKDGNAVFLSVEKNRLYTMTVFDGSKNFSIQNEGIIEEDGTNGVIKVSDAYGKIYEFTSQNDSLFSTDGIVLGKATDKEIENNLNELALKNNDDGSDITFCIKKCRELYLDKFEMNTLSIDSLSVAFENDKEIVFGKDSTVVTVNKSTGKIFIVNNNKSINCTTVSPTILRYEFEDESGKNTVTCLFMVCKDYSGMLTVINGKARFLKATDAGSHLLKYGDDLYKFEFRGDSATLIVGGNKVQLRQI